MTKRQQEIAELVALGWSNNDIAKELCISRYTVKNHVSSILMEIGGENRVHIARYVILGEKA